VIAVGPVLIWGGVLLLSSLLYVISQFWFGAVVAALAVMGVLISYAFWFVPRSRKPRPLVDRGFVTEAAPQGIVSLELAGNVDRAREIVKSWRDRSLDPSGPPRNVLAEVTAATGRDFGFIVAYMLVFAGATAWTLDVLSDHQWGPLWLRGVTLAATIGLLVVVAGLADIVENVFMLRMIAGAMASDRLPAWTRALALLKFSVLAVAAAYAGIGFFVAVTNL
jgi:hypothetical protein